jgi:hypothetical protein
MEQKLVKLINDIAEIKEAFNIVFDLAEQNIINEKDIPEEYKKQTNAIMFAKSFLNQVINIYLKKE